MFSCFAQRYQGHKECGSISNQFVNASKNISVHAQKTNFYSGQTWAKSGKIRRSTFSRLSTIDGKRQVGFVRKMCYSKE